MSSRQTKYHMYVSLQDDDRISIFTVDRAMGALGWQEDGAVDGGRRHSPSTPAGTTCTKDGQRQGRSIQFQSRRRFRASIVTDGETTRWQS